MKKFNLTLIICLIVLLMVSCGGGNNGKQGDNATETQIEQSASNDNNIQFVSAEGTMASDNEMRVNVEFDKAVPGIFASSFTSSAGKVNMVQCSSGNTMYWTVYVTGVTSSEQITLSIEKKGYEFNPSSRTVTVD